jgi:type IV fimbrial biogenesis protein FimT
MLCMKVTAMNTLKCLHGARQFRSTRSRAEALHGFTAVELLVVISIVAILATLAAPSFDATIKRWRVRDAREAMTAALYLARSEAIKRGGNVILVQTPADANCTPTPSSSWGCGWSVYFDANDNGSMDAGEQIQSYPAPKGLTVETGGAAQRLFDRWGIADGGGSLAAAIYPVNEGSSPAASTLCMSSSGRIQYLPGNVSCP